MWRSGSPVRDGSPVCGMLAMENRGCYKPRLRPYLLDQETGGALCANHDSCIATLQYISRAAEGISQASKAELLEPPRSEKEQMGTEDLAFGKVDAY